MWWIHGERLFILYEDTTRLSFCKCSFVTKIQPYILPKIYPSLIMTNDISQFIPPKLKCTMNPFLVIPHDEFIRNKKLLSFQKQHLKSFNKTKFLTLIWFAYIVNDDMVLYTWIARYFSCSSCCFM